jgi:cytochrome c oxidase subunit 3
VAESSATIESHGDEEHGLLLHHFDDLEQQRESTSLGMWLFLCTEIMMFGGLFFAYTLYRIQHTYAFIEGGRHLNITLGTGNTFVLLFSSLSMAMAVYYAQVRDKKKLVFFLGVTFILGAIFIGIKGIEWTTDYHEGLVPALHWFYFAEHPQAAADLAAHGVGPQNVMMYFVLYFCMTGLHAIHMIIGLLLVAYFMFLGNRGMFTNGNDQPVEIMGLYWHFVDIVWIFLFPLLYLIGGFHPFGGG